MMNVSVRLIFVDKTGPEQAFDITEQFSEARNTEEALGFDFDLVSARIDPSKGMQPCRIALNVAANSSIEPTIARFVVIRAWRLKAVPARTRSITARRARHMVYPLSMRRYDERAGPNDHAFRGQDVLLDFHT